MKHGVTIIGYTDLPSRLAKQSSTLYATNLFRLSEDLCKTKDGVINVNMEDEAIRGMTVIKDGEVTWPPPAPKLSAAPAAKPPAKAMPAVEKKGHGHGAGEPMAARTLALMFGGRSDPVPADRRSTRRRHSSGTSPCSCSPASSATWWCGTSRPRCTRR